MQHKAILREVSGSNATVAVFSSFARSRSPSTAEPPTRRSRTRRLTRTPSSAALDALGDRAGTMNPKTGQVYTVVNQDRDF
jgi:hypothetical protein